MTLKKNYSITLCLICQNYCGKCAWSKNLEAVEGWEAIVDYKKNGEIAHAWVGWCPEFIADAGLYDRIVHGDETEGRSWIIAQYGFLTMLRYATIRYRLINNYERTEADEDRPINDRRKLSLRQFYAAVKRKV